MEFNPHNPVVKRCLQGMECEATGQSIEAGRLFLQAWNEATNDFEKFIAAYYVARHQQSTTDKLKWLQEALQRALSINDDSVKAAFSALHRGMAECYEELNDADSAKKNEELAKSFEGDPSDNGPFYHGTKADLRVGDLLTA